MKPETEEWIQKAEGDMRTARREFAVDDAPNYDAVCFHSQQCAEKYFKATIVEAGLAVTRIHDLEVLLNQIIPLEPAWSVLLKPARRLSAMAVEVRYPGMIADADDAAEALRAAEIIRATIQASLKVRG